MPAIYDTAQSIEIADLSEEQKAKVTARAGTNGAWAVRDGRLCGMGPAFY